MLLVSVIFVPVEKMKVPFNVEGGTSRRISDIARDGYIAYFLILSFCLVNIKSPNLTLAAIATEYTARPTSKPADKLIIFIYRY